MTEG
jgi:hypothetical protein